MKSITRVEEEADYLIQQTLDTLISRWGQTKKFADSGVGGFGPGLTDRHKMLKILVRRTVAANARGSITRSAPATSVVSGQSAAL